MRPCPIGAGYVVQSEASQGTESWGSRLQSTYRCKERWQVPEN